MSEWNADVLEVLIAQMAEYGDINLVISKALSVLPETELLKPVRNLLHCGRTPRVSATWYALETARPSSRRLTNLKCCPRGYLGATAMHSRSRA